MEPYKIAIGALLALVPVGLYVGLSAQVTTIQAVLGIFNVLFIVGFLALMFGATESSDHHTSATH